MKKIAFYYNNECPKDKDFSGLLSGNPGVGGTEYEILLVSYLLETCDNDLDVCLLTRDEMSLPHPHYHLVGDVGGLFTYCKDNGIDVLVINQSVYNEQTVSQFETCSSRLGIILWDHNGMNNKKLDMTWKSKQVKRVVCCGREMLDMIRDNAVMEKSTYVYNIFPLKEKSYYQKRMDLEDNHNVVYMGALNKVKGFHVLARAWKSILRKVPDAQLYVIGSGRLYNNNTKLGRYGLAVEEFENEIIPYLEDDNGKLLPSVHFCGLMGTEKFDIMGRCKVGVPNPTGYSECLPITTIEMQLMGCNIVTIRHFAYLDTIFNHNYLYRKCDQLADYIAKRLIAPYDDYDRLYNFISEKFSTEKSIARWENILSNIDYPMPLEPLSPINYQMKWLKNILLHIKLLCPVLNKLPMIRSVIDKLSATKLLDNVKIFKFRK